MRSHLKLSVECTRVQLLDCMLGCRLDYMLGYMQEMLVVVVYKVLQTLLQSMPVLLSEKILVNVKICF